MAEAYLALGSNLGDRREQLRRALSSLSELGVQAVRVSSLYESDPMYVANQPTFLNAVLQAETELNP
ncbi:MAG TPA: 2-amino-4-hydroxy-6-hydroxymethyldihydropteridine diphosphokinase, partial [Chloroflexota bacterium]